MPSLAPGRLRQRRHDLDGDGVGVGLGAVELGVERLLADALAEAAAPGGTGEQVVDARVELGVGNRVVDQAPLGGGARRRSRRRSGPSPSAACGRCCAPRARRACGRTSRPCRPGSANARRLGGDGEVAGRHELAAGGRGDRVDAGDHDLRHRLDRAHQPRAQPQQVAHAGEVAGGDVGEVVARRRRPCPRRPSTMPVASERPGGLEGVAAARAGGPRRARCAAPAGSS